MAERHTAAKLTLGVSGSLLFVLMGALTWRLGHWLPSLVCVIFFGFSAMLWGYALYLKLRTGSPRKESLS